MSISVLFDFELFLLRGAARLCCRWSARVRTHRIPQRQLTVSTPNPIGQGTTVAKAAFLAASRVTHNAPPPRLVKRGEVAVLSFEINAATRMGRAVRIAHDVRVEILKREDASRLKEPMCPEPEVSHPLPFPQTPAAPPAC